MNKGINLLVFDEKNRILLQLRDQKPNIKNPGIWSLPGGRVHENESLDVSAKRELLEETGLKVNKVSWVGSHILNFEKETLEGFFGVIKTEKNARISCFEGQKMEFKTFGEILNEEIILAYRELVISKFLKQLFVNDIFDYFLCLAQLVFSNIRNGALSRVEQSNPNTQSKTVEE